METKMTDVLLISIVMPSYNEEQAVGVVLDDITRHGASFNKEIILVDSSTDRTAEIAQDKGAAVIQTPPAGHGAALRQGLSAARGDIIITADCDNTYPMEYIPKLIHIIQNEPVDLISCNRLTARLRKEMPFSNKVANKLFALLVRVLYGIAVRDVATGMFCLTRKLRDTIILENNLTVPIELIIKTHLAGFRQKEINIPYNVRIGDVTLRKWTCGIAALKCIFNYRFKLDIDPRKM